MYVKIMFEMYHQFKLKTMVFDILEGGITRVINATPAFKVLYNWGFHRVCFDVRKPSYDVTTATGTKEQFEKLNLNVKTLVPALKVVRFTGILKDKKYFEFLDGEQVKSSIPRENRTLVYVALVAIAGSLAVWYSRK